MSAPAFFVFEGAASVTTLTIVCVHDNPKMCKKVTKRHWECQIDIPEGDRSAMNESVSSALVHAHPSTPASEQADLKAARQVSALPTTNITG